MNNAAPYFDVTGHTLGSMATAPGGIWRTAGRAELHRLPHVHGNATTATPARAAWPRARVTTSLTRPGPTC